jgi:hypothetical protein
MNHFSLRARRARVSKAGNCRNFLMSSRARRYALAELDKTWGELRRHVMIEKDWEKVLRLAAELDERRRPPEVVDKRRDNC